MENFIFCAVKYVSINTQTCNELSANYIDIAVGSNNSLSDTVAHKSTETESECFQLVGSLHETTDLLKIELKDKQATIINFINVIKYVTVNEIKINGSREQ